jgi:hypothetical protein
MRHLLRYLWQSPLIRLTVLWTVLALVGISLFSFKLYGMRAQLSSKLQDSQSNIQAIQQLNQEKIQDNEEISSILLEIEGFRPNVPDLLKFVQTIEQLAESRKISMSLNSLKTEKAPHLEEQSVSYHLTTNSSLDDIQSLLKEFESLPFAIQITNISTTQTPERQTELEIIFTLHTKFS